MILWVLYARHVPRRAQWLLHVWFVLVGVSVLTTYQHHVIDIPTGALLGFFCLWLWPDRGASPWRGVRAHPRAAPARARRAAMRPARSCLSLRRCFSGRAAGWLLWPAVSLALVAANYAFFGAGRIPEGRRRPHEFCRARSAGALSRRRLAQFARLDAQRPGAGRRSRRGCARPYSRPAMSPPNSRRSSTSAPSCRCTHGEVGWRAFPMLDLVTPDRRRTCAGGSDNRAGARRRSGAGVLRARLFAQRRGGRGLAAHHRSCGQVPGCDRGGPPRAPADRARATTPWRRSRKRPRPRT